MQDDDLYAIWPLRLARGSGPRYRQIADLIERAVAENRLQPGDRLPPQRGLAQRLGIDLTTVTRGYNEAGLRGLLDPRGAAGTFISRRAEPAALVLDLGMNLPPPPLGCDMQELLRRGLARVMERQDVHVLMTYHRRQRRQRAAGAQWLSEAAEPADAEHVLVTPGAQAALAAVILACGRAGDAIVSEPLVYPGLLAAAEQLGRRVVVAETDDEGMTPTGLERACRESGSRLVYLNPTLQNPTTRTLTEARRCDLLRALPAARGDRGRSLSPVPGRRAADHGQPGARLGLSHLDAGQVPDAGAAHRLCAGAGPGQPRARAGVDAFLRADGHAADERAGRAVDRQRARTSWTACAPSPGAPVDGAARAAGRGRHGAGRAGRRHPSMAVAAGAVDGERAGARATRG